MRDDLLKEIRSSREWLTMMDFRDHDEVHRWLDDLLDTMQKIVEAAVHPAEPQ